MSDFSFLGSFEPNAILRGAQLTLVGANRALQNPAIFTNTHYRQAAYAVAAGIVIRLILLIPTWSVRALIVIAGLFTDLSQVTWDEKLVNGTRFLEHSVLQLPFFLMSLIRYMSPAMDQMFMDSLAWVDRTYVQKHHSEDPAALRAMYYPNLRLYDTRGSEVERKPRHSTSDAVTAFLKRFGKRTATSLVVYLASFLPYIGPLVLPAASFYTFNKAVGWQPAVIIFGSSVFVPKRYLVRFLQSYFSSRGLMRELLEPYFSRLHFSPQQKKMWFKEREGVLYGFALAFFIILKIPLLGVLIYGIAEASTAYLITKITSPPPPPAEAELFKQRDIKWVNKHEFLSLPLDKLDKLNIKASGRLLHPEMVGSPVPTKQFA
ncbi:hypothetical protein K470DRAFT_220377 [Piedraia hortae CBS 480.64]|uniref:Transmembrane protein UsgS n=1 Tax=Piedraia hortae CBS 480.64 TaxID=1314780 RepID=A0A6A7BUC7_9PEZI|nr:hypothetical protein K470DRAFT_220377 [Piedraia hortae CBS 480.64]